MYTKMAPHADNPLFVCLLLLLKYGHRSSVLNRRNTDQHNGVYVQFACSLNYRFEPQRSNESRVKKKMNRSLTCKQWINLFSTVAYTLNLQILFGLHEQIHCRIFEQKERYIVQNLVIDRPVSLLTTISLLAIHGTTVGAY